VQQRAAVVGSPGEVAADRAAQLELVAGLKLVDEIGRHLAVVEPLHRQRQTLVLGRGRDGVRALRLIAVLGGQPDVDVLPGDVPRPLGHVEHDRARASGLFGHAEHRRQPPDDRRPPGQTQSFQ
jgi:hypothetical protein